MAWSPSQKPDEPSLFDEESGQDSQLKTKITWEFIVLEELRTVNRLIMEAGRNLSKYNVFTLKQTIDSWEKTLTPIVMLPDNKKLVDEANKYVDDSMIDLMKNWTFENYFLAVGSLIEKKGAIIKVLANAGRYMPIFTNIKEGVRNDQSSD